MIKGRSNKAFTLIELIITIFIVGLLATIALPTYFNYALKGRYTEMVNASGPYKNAIEVCYQSTGSLNNCLAGQNGIPQNILNSNEGLVAYIFVVGNGVIYVFPNNLYGFSMIGDYYSLTPSITRNGLVWQFGGPGVKYIQ